MGELGGCTARVPDATAAAEVAVALCSPAHTVTAIPCKQAVMINSHGYALVSLHDQWPLHMHTLLLEVPAVHS